MAEGTPYSTDKANKSTAFPTGKSNAGHDLRDQVGEQFDRVAENVEGMAKTVADRSREVGGNVQAVAGNLKSAVDASIKDQPMTTLAVVAVLGFVLGAVWKS